MQQRTFPFALRTVLVCAIALCAWSASDASGNLSGSIASIEGNTVSIEVVNASEKDCRASIRVYVTVNGFATWATSNVTVPGGGTVIAPIVLDTITDDIDPLDVHFGITE